MTQTWNLGCKLSDPMDVLQFRIRAFRRLVRWWANNVIAEMNKYKQVVVAEFNFLDFEVENRSSDKDERLRMKSLARELE